VMCSKAFSIFFMATLSLVSSSCRHIPGRWTARNSTECLAYAWNVSSIIQKYISNMGWIRMDSDGLCMFIIYNFHIWVCLKIVYPYTQWLMIIIPIKWL
jgi:hypothetical protein